MVAKSINLFAIAVATPSSIWRGLKLIHGMGAVSRARLRRVATPSSIWRGLKLALTTFSHSREILCRDPFLDLERTETQAAEPHYGARPRRDPFLDLERTETTRGARHNHHPMVATPSSIWRGLKPRTRQ